MQLFGESIDLVSTDIDGQDDWVWQVIESRRRVVIVESTARGTRVSG
jgi:hypothetical protein